MSGTLMYKEKKNDLSGTLAMYKIKLKARMSGTLVHTKYKKLSRRLMCMKSSHVMRPDQEKMGKVRNKANNIKIMMRGCISKTERKDIYTKQVL